MEGGLLLGRHVAFLGYGILNKRGKTMRLSGAFGTGGMWPVSDGFCDLVFHKKGRWTGWRNHPVAVLSIGSIHDIGRGGVGTHARGTGPPLLHGRGGVTARGHGLAGRQSAEEKTEKREANDVHERVSPTREGGDLRGAPERGVG